MIHLNSTMNRYLRLSSLSSFPLHQAQHPISKHEPRTTEHDKHRIPKNISEVTNMILAAGVAGINVSETETKDSDD